MALKTKPISEEMKAHLTAFVQKYQRDYLVTLNMVPRITGTPEEGENTLDVVELGSLAYGDRNNPDYASVTELQTLLQLQADAAKRIAVEIVQAAARAKQAGLSAEDVRYNRDQGGAQLPDNVVGFPVRGSSTVH